ncbi:MAG: hypothetical protein IT450_04985 [Phycisphaerales bacterium]|nr:hypothetical protein [Phycisphaerales bacterium]
MLESAQLEATIDLLIEYATSLADEWPAPERPAFWELLYERVGSVVSPPVSSNEGTFPDVLCRCRSAVRITSTWSTHRYFKCPRCGLRGRQLSGGIVDYNEGVHVHGNAKRQAG